MPNARQQLILELVQSQNIETQEQLIDLLRQRGIETSQTTISRDIRKLRLIKERISEDRYRYAMPADQGPVIDNDAHSQRLWRIFRQGVLSIACVQNFVVIKAMPGLGPAAGAAVDDYGFDAHRDPSAGRRHRRPAPGPSGAHRPGPGGTMRQKRSAGRSPGALFLSLTAS